jgi:quercetin 2,3-dioxygenase
MGEVRKALRVSKSKATIEGAGVHLKRAFGFTEVPRFDPFLMLDDFRGDDPSQYRSGFPWHPHRGIETVTYMIAGRVEHGDSLGNSGVIGPGDIQWMTAGSGIIHQEMPAGDARGRMGGFQLWANLPASQKMMDPRYRDVKSGDVPSVQAGDALVRVIAGSVAGSTGPVRDVVIEPEYLDVSVRAGGSFEHEVRRGHTAFAYVVDGGGRFSDGEATADGSLVLFGDGELVTAKAGAEGFRFLLVSGKPLGEPVAWYGPVVMNTDAEIEEAFAEYRAGTFVKKGKPRDIGGRSGRRSP